VIFLPGWGLTDPGAYRRWLHHLAAAGNTVIVPRYQNSVRDDPAHARRRMLTAVRRALARAPAAPGTLVVAGHSAGAALAADYAAVARSQRLPEPVAVFAVYPGRRILGYPAGIPPADLSRIAPRTRLKVLWSALDAVVGQEPARQLVAQTAHLPPQRRRLIEVAGAAADHYAPTRADAAARAAFWRRLDRLIEAAR
jgi:acetyl esterase/lipase